jgi:ribonuclease P protein component
VAFSLNRALGPAVTRNRLRRRLRSILRERDAPTPGGMLMIGAYPRAIELTFDQLRTELHQLLTKATTATPTMNPATADPASRV